MCEQPHADGPLITKPFLGFVSTVRGRRRKSLDLLRQSQWQGFISLPSHQHFSEVCAQRFAGSIQHWQGSEYLVDPRQRPTSRRVPLSAHCRPDLECQLAVNSNIDPISGASNQSPPDSEAHLMLDASCSSHVHGRSLVNPRSATEAEVHTPALTGTRP